MQTIKSIPSNVKQDSAKILKHSWSAAGTVVSAMSEAPARALHHGRNGAGSWIELQPVGLGSSLGARQTQSDLLTLRVPKCVCGPRKALSACALFRFRKEGEEIL